MDHGPRRTRSHGDTPRPRLAGAPFIPAATDPEIEAARAATAAAHAIDLREHVPVAHRRIVAFAVDLLMVGLLAAVARDMNPALPLAVVLLFGWAIIRFLPIALLGQTPGQTLAGYEVRGPRGEPIGPLRAIARDAILLTGGGVLWLAGTVLWLVVTVAAAAIPLDGGSTRNGRAARLPRDLDARWPHDLMTDSWVVVTRNRPDAPTPGAAPPS